MKFLLTTTEVYRVDNEAEAEKLIEEAKADNHFILSKYQSQFKEKKQKGEVIESYHKVTLVKEFTSEKEPEFSCNITYTDGLESAF